MPGPIVFISRFSIKEGGLEPMRDLARDVSADIQASKPGTLVYLSYVDAAQHTISFVHAFADRASMDRHFEGADDRSRAAYEFIEPRGWEVYGAPSDGALATLQGAAASAGASLAIHPEFVAGFLRVGGGA